MKLKLLTLALVIAAGTVVTPAHAGTKDYIRICDSLRLTIADRMACKSEMLAATTDMARLQIFRIYDYKTVGFAIDGTRLKPVQQADAK